MATHFWKNTDVKTEALLAKIVSKFFVPLKQAKILIVYRDKEKTDDEGNIIVATASKVGTEERDIWGPDFKIIIDAEIWGKADKMTKYRILYHELRHCGVECEEGSSEPKYDDNNRLKTYIIKHNIYLKTFKEEIEIFGLDGSDKETAEFMSEMLESKDVIKKNKKDFMAKLGIEIHAGLKDSDKKKKRRDEDDDEDDGDDVAAKKRRKLKKQAALEEEADRLLGLKKKKKKTAISMSTAKKKKKPVDEDDEDDED